MTDAIERLWKRHRPDSKLLALFLVVAATLAGLGKLAGEVSEGDSFAIDRLILRGLRTAADPAVPIAPHWVTTFFNDATALGGVPVLTLTAVFAVGYLLAIRKRGAAIYVAVAIASGAIATSILKSVFERARPEVVPHLVEVDSASFPSGHAMNSALIYLTLSALVARTQESTLVRLYLIGSAIVLTLFVGISRIYLGVHYPTDVVAGWGVGASWAIVASYVAKWLQRERKIEGTGDEPAPAGDKTPVAGKRGGTAA